MRWSQSGAPSNHSLDRSNNEEPDLNKAWVKLKIRCRFILENWIVPGFNPLSLCHWHRLPHAILCGGGVAMAVAWDAQATAIRQKNQLLFAAQLHETVCPNTRTLLYTITTNVARADIYEFLNHGGLQSPFEDNSLPNPSPDSYGGIRTSISHQPLFWSNVTAMIAMVTNFTMRDDVMIPTDLSHGEVTSLKSPLVSAEPALLADSGSAGSGIRAAVRSCSTDWHSWPTSSPFPWRELPWQTDRRSGSSRNFGIFSRQTWPGFFRARLGWSWITTKLSCLSKP